MNNKTDIRLKDIPLLDTYKEQKKDLTIEFCGDGKTDVIIVGDSTAISSGACVAG
jgi:hypothetical protein